MSLLILCCCGMLHTKSCQERTLSHISMKSFRLFRFSEVDATRLPDDAPNKTMPRQGCEEWMVRSHLHVADKAEPLNRLAVGIQAGLLGRQNRQGRSSHRGCPCQLFYCPARPLLQHLILFLPPFLLILPISSIDLLDLPIAHSNCAIEPISRRELLIVPLTPRIAYLFVA